MAGRIDGIDPDSTGGRVQRLRRRAHMTQQQLGDAVKRDQSWVSKVENNSVEIDSISVLHALARALRAHPNEITGRPYHGMTDEDAHGQSAVMELVRQLRRADLTAESDTHRPLDDLAAEVTRLSLERGQAKYTQLAHDAITLLAELHVAYERLTGRQRERAYTLFALACKEVHSVAYGLGYPELIAHAQTRAAWAAHRSGDSNLPVIADYLAARDHWTTNDFSDAMFLLDRTAQAVQPAAERGEAAAVSLYGAAHLRAAVTAARANNADEAYTRLDLAQEALGWADPGGDPYALWWSAGNIGLHRVGVAVELGDGAEAVRRARGFVIPKELPASRLGHYYLDLTRGFVWINNVERAVASLERAERLAPQLVRNHPMAQAAVRQLLRLERAATRERLRSISNRFHVE